MNGEWINVEDQQPPWGEPVLISNAYRPDGGVTVSGYHRHDKDGYFFKSDFNGFVLRATHWMRLPEPPMPQEIQI